MSPGAYRIFGEMVHSVLLSVAGMQTHVLELGQGYNATADPALS